MAVYSVEADIIEVIPSKILAQLTDDVNTVKVIDSAIVIAMIAKADNQINTYIRGQHRVVPLTVVPPRIKDMSVNLAVFYFYKRRVDLEIPEPIRIDYDNTISELKLIMNNKLIIDDDASVGNTAGYYKSNKTADSRIFTQNDSQNGVLDRYFSKGRITPC